MVRAAFAYLFKKRTVVTCWTFAIDELKFVTNRLEKIILL